MRRIGIIITLILAAVAVVTPMAADTLPGYDTRDEITSRLSQLPLVDIEGIWLFPATGQTIVVERDDEDAMSFRVVAALRSLTGVSAGTLLGHVTPTARTGSFDAMLTGMTANGKPQGHSAMRPTRFTLSLTSDRLAFTPVHRGVKINWWRLFPYMFRFSVRTTDDRQQGLDGCIRLWPRDPSVPPYQPRYL